MIRYLTSSIIWGIEESKIPYDSSIKLTENTGRTVAQLEYASAIGSLMYAMHCTRPDIVFVVGKLLSFTSSPSNFHWNAIIKVFEYLKKTKYLDIHYNDFPTVDKDILMRVGSQV